MIIFNRRVLSSDKNGRICHYQFWYLIQILTGGSTVSYRYLSESISSTEWLVENCFIYFKVNILLIFQQEVFYWILIFFHLSVSRVKGRQIKASLSHQILLVFNKANNRGIEGKKENCVSITNFSNLCLYSITFLVCNSPMWINLVWQGFSCLSSLFRLMPFFFFECLCDSYKVLEISMLRGK